VRQGFTEHCATSGRSAFQTTIEVNIVSTLLTDPKFQERLRTLAKANRESVPAPADSFFDRNLISRPEIIEGIIRENDFGVLGGAFGIGKSPTLQSLAVHTLYGVPWCGRAISQRPVVHFDFESKASDYKQNIRTIAARLGKPIPKVPDDLDAYLAHDNVKNEPSTKQLLDATNMILRLELLQTALKAKPNALVLIDPLELMFSFDDNAKKEVISLYKCLRTLMADFPEAAVIGTFNLKKQDKKHGKADLFTEPRVWLEEISGSLAISYRADVRLGIDYHGDDEIRVINGVRRGEDMHPLLIRQAYHNDALAGFELSPPNSTDELLGLTEGQKGYWKQMPETFRFEEVAKGLVPRSTLSKITAKMKSLGLLTKDKTGLWHKVKAGG
jgi:hypothetical protein